MWAYPQRCNQNGGVGTWIGLTWFVWSGRHRIAAPEVRWRDYCDVAFAVGHGGGSGVGTWIGLAWFVWSGRRIAATEARWRNFCGETATVGPGCDAGGWVTLGGPVVLVFHAVV